MGHSSHGKYTEMIFAILAGGLLGLGFALSFWEAVPDSISLYCYWGAYFFGGFFTVQEAYQGLVKGYFHIDFLMLVAAVGAAFLGAWAEGALLLFLFSLGHALEHFAMDKARKSISSLTDIVPKTALLKTESEVSEVAISTLIMGDIILVRPNSRIPVDGWVISGEGSVNQAPITGESIPVHKFPVENKIGAVDPQREVRAENRVFSGSINGSQVLEIQVFRKSEDSTLSRMVKMVKEAQKQKSPTQLFTDKFERYFVPLVLFLVIALNFVFLVRDELFKDSFYRAMAVLVAASPCALAISTPSAVLSGVARAARAGILVKGGRPLEDLGKLDAMAFDKTGTLTEGRPSLYKIIGLTDLSETQLLETAMAVEKMSDHHLGKAIYRAGLERFGTDPTDLPLELKDHVGKGVTAKIKEYRVCLGNLKLYEHLKILPPSTDILEKVRAFEKTGFTTLLLTINEEYVGLLALADAPRPHAKATLEQLKRIGIKKMVMLTGDQQGVAESIGQQVGMDEVYGGLLPEEKVEVILSLKKSLAGVAMVGDGVNDAPAMAHSTVGIAMGAAGNDVAMETADIALMGSRLDSLPFAIALSRATRTIIKQNLWISLGMVAVLVPLTLFDVAGIGPAVIMHEGSTLFVVANALRLLGFEK